MDVEMEGFRLGWIDGKSGWMGRWMDRCRVGWMERRINR